MNSIASNQLDQLACGEDATSSSSPNVALTTQKPTGDDLSSGTFDIPGSLSSFLFQQNLTGGCYSLQAVSWATDLSSGGSSRKRDTQPSGTRSGTVFSLVISGVSDVPGGVLITIELDSSSPALQSFQDYVCSYRQDIDYNWSEVYIYIIFPLHL
jgi:hypothetical protein